MWALGAERKIITTNTAVKQYDFYTPEQIFVVDDVCHFVDDPAFDIFVKTEYHMSSDMRKIVESYRIDNWINNLFE